ncbi:MAG: glycosyl hydrolase 108 family protein [Alphaproteobacteria bacterium]
MSSSHTDTTNTLIGEENSNSSAAFGARNEKDMRLVRQLDDPQLQGNLFGLLLMFLFGMKSQDGDTPQTDIADNKTTVAFSEFLGLDPANLQSMVDNVRSGEMSVGAAATALLTATDHRTADVTSADRALGEYNNLKDLPPVDDANFLDAVNVVLKLEGGWNPNEPDGGYANFGINNLANPDIDVRNLNQSQAVHLYKDRYWDQIDGIDKMDQRAALVAFDLAVNSGAGRANQFLRELEESGQANLETGQVDVAALMQKREAFYDTLVDNNPQKFARYESGWDKRLEHLSAAVEQIPEKTQLASTFDNALSATSPAPLEDQPAPYEWKNLSNTFTGFSFIEPGSTDSIVAQNVSDVGTAPPPVGYGVLKPEYLPDQLAQNDDQYANDTPAIFALGMGGTSSS